MFYLSLYLPTVSTVSIHLSLIYRSPWALQMQSDNVPQWKCQVFSLFSASHSAGVLTVRVHVCVCVCAGSAGVFRTSVFSGVLLSFDPRKHIYSSHASTLRIISMYSVTHVRASGPVWWYIDLFSGAVTAVHLIIMHGLGLQGTSLHVQQQPHSSFSTLIACESLTLTRQAASTAAGFMCRI